MKFAQIFFLELILLYRPFENQLNSLLSEYNLHRAQWTILYYLYHNGTATNVEISHYQSVEKPTITRSFHNLEDAGYIERAPSKDKREKRMQLTKAGMEIYEKVRVSIDEFEERILEGISKEKQLEAIEMMKQIKANITN